MKRLFTFGFFALLLSTSGFSQTMQASIGAGSAQNRIRLYIKPTGGATINGTISTLQFNVAIPASITPVPTLSIVGAPAIGSGWVIDQTPLNGIDYPYVEDGYRHYQVVTAASFSVNIPNETETLVMELQFDNGPAGGDDVSLLTLPLGGSITGNALFLCTGAANSVDNQLYYIRPGTTAINNPTYGGGPISRAMVSGIVLPLDWLSFDVTRQGNDGLLSWKVSNEETNHHYDLQRSLNGIDYISIGTVNKTGSGAGVKDYSYTDRNITTLGASIVYYRLRQVDIDGRSTLSPVRMIRLNMRGNGQISVFPNPVKDGFYVNVPFENPNSKMVKLNLVGANGQLVKSREISALQATNYYFETKSLALAAGQYQLQIFHDGQLLDTKQLVVSNQ